jgi:Holliday junction resolvase RusA-like endonuclease
MDELKFTIPLVPVTKKNHSQIIFAGGRRKVIPSDSYRQYENDCGWYLPKVNTITSRVNVKALYYMPTHRRVDLCNLHAALHDILVKYQVIEDDNSKIVVSTDGSRVLYDKDHPRTEVVITEVE